MQFRFSANSARFAISALMIGLLAACGGGGGGGTAAASGGSAPGDSISIRGQVVDAPIAGALVCLYLDGAAARNDAGSALCSTETDAAGNYTLTMPRRLSAGVLSLVAAKGSSIKLASSLGTLDQVLAAADGGVVTSAALPSVRVTHLTTADFVLADTDNDGTVSQAELAAYKPDFEAVQKVASAVKAVIDHGQSALLEGQTTDTLSLASAAARNQVLGSTGQTADEWFADAANAEVIAAVNGDVAETVSAGLSTYTLTVTTETAVIPPIVTANGGSSSIYCQVSAVGDVETEQVSFGVDAARRIAVLQDTNEDGETVRIAGSYDPATGAIGITEHDPRSVSLVTPTTTFWHEGFFKMAGKLDASGNVSGTYNEMSANTWSIDATRQQCTGGGTFTLTKR
jgi:hypothetical protein